RVHIKSGVNGLAVPEGDRRGFIAAAVKLAREPELVASMRRRARAAMEAVDWAHVVERFERLLTGVARREENDRDEHSAVARPGAWRGRRGWARGAEARGRALHHARAVADAAPAAAAVAPDPHVSLRGGPVLRPRRSRRGVDPPPAAGAGKALRRAAGAVRDLRRLERSAARELLGSPVPPRET